MERLGTEDYKRIIARRDARYDGRFYFGVKTTRIYCRPVCPARPKPQNILIFKSLSEAEKAGYRPCLRCRPDASPGSKLWEGTSNTVSRALRLIDESIEDQAGVERLSEALGVTDRHLRRLFDEHLGASPIEILTTKRLHFARQLIQETRQPISEIAFASGFGSIRRFNEAFKALYHRAPSSLREGARELPSDQLRFVLSVRPPYDWQMVMAYLKRHETYGVERVDESGYLRFIPRKGSYGTLQVARGKREEQLEVKLMGISLSEVRGVLTQLRRLLDLEHNPCHLPTSAALDPGGVRVPGCFDAYETAISIILSQLVSTTQAKQSLAKLVTRFGKKLGQEGDQEVFVFPSPELLARAEIESIGLTRAKGGAIRELSKRIADRSIVLNAASDLESTRAALLAIPGIGPWTVEMISMRCLGDSDAFPKNDLVIQRALQSGAIDPAPWISFRAYLTHCLWKNHGGVKK